MNARYTSPDLSRQLAEAGVEQGDLSYSPCWRIEAPVPFLYDRGYPDDDGRSERYRALRLDDVLEELTRDREGGPLCMDYQMTPERFIAVRPTEVTEYGYGVPPEAAGSVLLALMRERGGE